MNRARVLFLVASLAVVVPIATGGLSRAIARDEPKDDSLYKNLSIFTEVLQLVRQAYVDERPLDSLMAGAFEGTTDALGPFATYIPKEEVEAYAKSRQIGDGLSGMTVAKERGITYVASVTAGSPGDEAGIEAGDVLSKLGGRSTEAMGLWEVQKILADASLESLDVQVLRQGQPHDKVVALGPFVAPTAAVEIVDEAPVLRLQSFSRETPDQVAKLLSELTRDGTSRLVVDLRGGSSGESAIGYEVAKLFVDGELGQLIGREGAIASFAGDSAPLWHGELVVLVDQTARGPAEVLAVVLRDRLEATLVGEPTFGHAGREKLTTLSNGAQILLTDAFYSGPSGEPLVDGLTPDVEVEEERQASDASGEQDRDPILERGIEVLLNGAEERKAA